MREPNERRRDGDAEQGEQQNGGGRGAVAIMR
jgi:hypothetical protein